MMRDPRMTERDYERSEYPTDYGSRSYRPREFSEGEYEQGEYGPRERGFGRMSEERGYRERGYGASGFGQSQRAYDYGQRDYAGGDFGERESSRGGTQMFPRSWEGPFQGVGPRNYSRSDDRIREDVSDRLAMHGGVDARQIDV